jgi:hypothetical protein
MPQACCHAPRVLLSWPARPAREHAMATNHGADAPQACSKRRCCCYPDPHNAPGGHGRADWAPYNLTLLINHKLPNPSQCHTPHVYTHDSKLLDTGLQGLCSAGHLQLGDSTHVGVCTLVCHPLCSAPHTRRTCLPAKQPYHSGTAVQCARAVGACPSRLAIAAAYACPLHTHAARPSEGVTWSSSTCLHALC